MSQQTKRHYKLKHLLNSGRCLSTRYLLTELGTFAATLKRDLAFFCHRLNAPLIYDRIQRGDRLELDAPKVVHPMNCPVYGFSPMKSMRC